MNLLSEAIILAAKYHDGQVDKGGNPYIVHPLRLMTQCDTDEEMITAVLHDVVEDTEATIDDLITLGFPATIIQAVDALTRREGETYMQFIDRVKKNEIATQVKILDIEDNMDLTRIAQPTEQDRSRVDRYEKALKVLKTYNIPYKEGEQ